MDSPGIADILGTIIYAIVIILLAAAQGSVSRSQSDTVRLKRRPI
jgi:hypothetical protein